MYIMDEKDWGGRSAEMDVSDEVAPRGEKVDGIRPQDEEVVVDLVEPIPDEEAISSFLEEVNVRRQIEETAERVAREMFPEIAARVIREEIEKLKREK